MLSSGEDSKNEPFYPLQIPSRGEIFEDTYIGKLNFLTFPKLRLVPTPRTPFEYRAMEGEGKREARLKALLESFPDVLSQNDGSSKLFFDSETQKTKEPKMTYLDELTWKWTYPPHPLGGNASMRLDWAAFRMYADAEEGKWLPLHVFPYGRTDSTPELGAIFHNEPDLDGDKRLNAAKWTAGSEGGGK